MVGADDDGAIMSAAALILVYLAVILAPVGLAVVADLPPRPFLDDLSSGLAMAAFAAIFAEFALSGRFRLISQGPGVDMAMRFHQLFARTALAFALIHPFLYTLPSLAHPHPADPTAARSLMLGGGAVVSGAAGWVGLALLTLTAIARDSLLWRYQDWRLAHGAGAALVAGAVLHHALHAGRYTIEAPAVRALWIGLAALAALALLWVWLIAPLLRLGARFRVVGVRRLADRLWSLRVARADGRPFRYRAGQFVWLRVAPSPFGLADNPFSIVSAPASGPEVEFLVKEAGDFTRTVGSIPPGSAAWLDGPHGSLTIPRAASGVGLVAGGSGVAPLVSVLRQMRATGDDRPVRLLYADRREDQLVCVEELRALLTGPGSRLTIALSEPPEGWRGVTGVVDLAALKTCFGDVRDLARWRFLVCGPPGMIDSAEAGLRVLGVRERDIRSERFVYD
jgi:predicted ferric reductase